MKYIKINFPQKLGLYVCLSIIMISSFMPLKVFAIDADFYGSNDILFYDPDASGCADPSSLDGGYDTSGDAGYKLRLETALKFLTGKGLSLAAASGIAANLKYESGIAPTRIQSTPASVKAPDDYQPVNKTGFGIAQWTFTSRQSALKKYAQSQGKNITDITIQLEFLWKEATTDSSYNKMIKSLNSIKSDSPYKGVDPAVAATVLFHGRTDKIMRNATVQKVDPSRGFEGSADTGEKVVNERGGAATSIFNEYKGNIADGTGVVGIGTGGGDTGNSSTGATDCGDGAVAGDIASTAINFALDKPATEGMNKRQDATPAYLEALDKYNKGANVADCGMFVGTVMLASEADPNYPKSSTATQIDYVKKTTDKYKIIDSPKKSDLQAGDILIVNNGSDHHTMIYTGDTKYPAADASQDTRVPSVRDSGSLDYMLGLSGLVAARIIK